MVLLTPSVTLVVNFDSSNNGDEDEQRVSVYRGSAHVCVKDSIFQPSSAIIIKTIIIIMYYNTVSKRVVLWARPCGVL